MALQILTDKKLKSLQRVAEKTGKQSKTADGGGLYFVATPTGSAYFTFRYQIDGKRREMGVGGGYPHDTGLADARATHADLRAAVKAGQDPLEAPVASGEAMTVKDAFGYAMDAKRESLKGGGAAGRWDSPVRLHILPKLGHVAVSKLSTDMVEAVLKPIWKTKPEAARKALSRFKIILDQAKARGASPADPTLIDDLKVRLGNQPKGISHAFMPAEDVPAFFASLDGQHVSHRALKLLILTGHRSGPIRHATAEMVDRDRRILTVPGNLMKGRVGETQDFRTPLSDAAMAVIDACPREGLLFPNGSRPVSDMAMLQVMNKRGLAARPHGFRSSLRTWMEDMLEAGTVEWVVAEMCLQHRIGGVAGKYIRTDMLEKRRAVMDLWGDFVAPEAGNVVRFKRA